jgi:Hypothetical protein (DUF2513)
MKRNLDLIRKMMQALEQDEQLDGRSVYICYASQLFAFPEHNEKELAYNLMMIIDEAWLDAEYITASGSFLFKRLTVEGHDFIDSTRDLTVWERAKSTARAAGGETLSLLGRPRRL